MPADDGALLGSPAWPLVPRPEFMGAVRQVGTMSSGTGINGSDTSASACWRARVRA